LSRRDRSERLISNRQAWAPYAPTLASLGADEASAPTRSLLKSEYVSINFQVNQVCGSGRVGRLATPHAVIDTPVFMPVGTVASVKGVPQDIVEELGAQIILGNTYHLYLRPGVEIVRRMGGLHRFMSWDRALLTDSGGFQVFSLSELRKLNEDGVTFRSHLDGSSHFFSPESAMAAQIGLGADIIMAFDECTEYPADAGRVRASMELTARWAARSKKYFEEHKGEVPWGEVSGFEFQVSGEPNARNLKLETRNLAAELRSAGQPPAVPTNSEPTQALFGIVQGGMDRELRRESALRTVEIGFPGYAIGGLSVGEPRELTREIVESTLEHLPKDKPRYLMGVGNPEEIVEYAGVGVDMMDCVQPTRAARHGLLFTSQGKISIKQARYADDPEPLDPNCGCRVCRRYSRAYLRHLYASNELLAQVLNTIHNVSFYLDTMKRVRHSISLGEESRSLSAIWSRPTAWDLPGFKPESWRNPAEVDLKPRGEITAARRRRVPWRFADTSAQTSKRMQYILAVQTGSGGMGWLGIAPLIFIFAIFYFLLIMPQQRRQKKWQGMLEKLKTGDKVTTSGGLRGTIMALRDDCIHLRVPPNNLLLEVTKASVVQVSTTEEPEVKTK
jgi:queuine tRNA-ribosyltransferase